MHPNSKMIFEKYALPYFKNDMKVLEIGPNNFPSTLQECCSEIKLDWQTLDIYDDKRLTYSTNNEYIFPIESETFDVVVSANVIEHVKKIWCWLPELARVTKQGGIVITVNPVSWIYHAHPVDCWRIYPDGMKSLYEDSGLKVEVAEWGSFEMPGYKRYFPGISLSVQSPKRKFLQRIAGKLGVPVERAYDNIAIGRKLN